MMMDASVISNIFFSFFRYSSDYISCKCKLFKYL